MTQEEFYKKYKDGDFIVFDEHWMVIFAEFTNPGNLMAIGRDYHAIVYYALLNLTHHSQVTLIKRTGIGYIETREARDIRLATNNEIKTFCKILQDHNYEWDADSKQLIKHEVLSVNYTE
jgi:hypothetical protein